MAALCCALAVPTEAKVALPGVFADHMVLQQDTQAAFWGTATPGQTVAVTGSWSGTPVSTVAGADGRWSLSLPTPVARGDGTSYTVTVKESNTVTFTDVLVGEVWLLTGQSNMAMGLRGFTGLPVEGGQEAIAAANNDRLRFLVVGDYFAATPQDDITRHWDTRANHWTGSTPSSVPNLSAVGYFFGLDLQQDLGIPVGLIQVASGGSTCQTWTPPEALQQVAAYNGKGPWEPTATWDNQSPTTAWNGMMYPVHPYTVRGALWYQGEANVGSHRQYVSLFPQLIRGWRDAWGGGRFHFFFALIAPYSGDPGEYEALMWEAQESALYLPDTDMVVTTDLVDPDGLDNLHPPRKRPIGERFAALARARVYGEDIPCHGPIYKGLRVEGGAIRLLFDHVESGLTAREDHLSLFEVAGADGAWHPAEATIDGGTVLVSHQDVPVPVAARYAWAGAVTGELFNGDGFPAAPFRTNPGSHVISHLGRPLRLGHGTGFFVNGGVLFDPTGVPWVGAGVNAQGAAMDDDSLRDIREVTGANLVRIAWRTDTGGSAAASVARLGQVVQRCATQGMVPVVSFIDVEDVGDRESLATLADTLTSPDFLTLFRRFASCLVLEPAAGWAPVDAKDWRDGSLDLVATLRTRNGGTDVPLAIGSSDPLHFSRYGPAVLASDPEGNTLYALDLRGDGTTPETVGTTFANLKSRNIQTLVTAFGPGTDGGSLADAIMDQAAYCGYSYAASAWTGADAVGSDLANGLALTPWGERVVDGPDGTRANGAIAPVFAVLKEDIGVSFEDWAWLHSVDDVTPLAPQADDDGDSLDNFSEYLWGLNPWKPDRENRVEIEGHDLTFRVSTDPLGTGQYFLETSSDFGFWKASGLLFDPETQQWSMSESQPPTNLWKQKADGSGWSLTFRSGETVPIFMRIRFDPETK